MERRDRRPPPYPKLPTPPPGEGAAPAAGAEKRAPAKTPARPNETPAKSPAAPPAAPRDQRAPSEGSPPTFPPPAAGVEPPTSASPTPPAPPPPLVNVPAQQATWDATNVTDTSDAAVAPVPRRRRAVRAPTKLWTPGPRVTAMGVIILCAIFGGLSFFAVSGKSATYDEPLHAVAGHVIRHTGDYRIDPEDGALFLRWAALFHGKDSLPKYDLAHDEDCRMIFDMVPSQGPWVVHGRQWLFVVRTLYQSGLGDVDTFLNRSRMMFVFVGMVLGGLIGWWGWKLGGWLVALVATFLYALDPNFLAHAGIIKNDVPLSMLMLWLAIAVWMLGRRITVPRLLLVAIACGAALNVKFSALLFAPMVTLLLCVRALIRVPWPVPGRRTLDTPLSRLGAAVLCCVFVAGVSWLSIWCTYGFRYAPTTAATSDTGRPRLFDMASMRVLAAHNELEAAAYKQAAKGQRQDRDILFEQPQMDEVQHHKVGAMPALVLWLDEHHLLPQAWTYGLIYTYATTQYRSTFLNGKYSNVGWWYYFPAAMYYKTPTMTMLAALVVLLAWLLAAVMRRVRHEPSPPPPAMPVSTAAAAAADPRELAVGHLAEKLDLWSVLCLLVPPVIYAFAAITTNLNLGLRHILPVYPFIFLGMAIGLKRMIVRWPRFGAVVTAVMVVGLVMESALAFPDYLPFFNLPAGGTRGGMYHLSDSNLDWGQDLRLLAAWQEQHPDVPMYLVYFGTADPDYYHISRQDLVGGWAMARRRLNFIPNVPGVVAISVTNLQGQYLDQRTRDVYKGLFWDKEPREVLGGSIYIYDWPPPGVQLAPPRPTSQPRATGSPMP